MSDKVVTDWIQRVLATRRGSVQVTRVLCEHEDIPRNAGKRIVRLLEVLVDVLRSDRFLALIGRRGLAEVVGYNDRHLSGALRFLRLLERTDVGNLASCRHAWLYGLRRDERGSVLRDS
jgi:hypothetical protein